MGEGNGGVVAGIDVELGDEFGPKVSMGETNWRAEERSLNFAVPRLLRVSGSAQLGVAAERLLDSPLQRRTEPERCKRELVGDGMRGFVHNDNIPLHRFRGWLRLTNIACSW